MRDTSSPAVMNDINLDQGSVKGGRGWDKVYPRFYIFPNPAPRLRRPQDVLSWGRRRLLNAPRAHDVPEGAVPGAPALSGLARGVNWLPTEP